MAVANEEKIVQELQAFDIQVNEPSFLDRLCDISREYALDPSNLCGEWVAFSTQNGDCKLDSENLERFEASLRTKSRKTPLSRRTVSKTRRGGQKLLNKDDLGSMFDDDDIIGQYATPDDTQRLKNQKRTAEQTTPTTPASKTRHTHNGATPVTSRPSNTATPTRTYAPNLNGSPATPYNSGTPAGKYSQRKVAGRVVTSLNDAAIPSLWRGTEHEMVAKQLIPLKSSDQFMFQKVSEKAFALIDRIEKFGREICQFNQLPDPLSVAQPSLVPAVYTGQVVCEGEGHLNARSCLLEGPIGRTRKTKGKCVRMNIPDSIACSLFPGQVVAVEGINNYSGMLVPSKIYDEGVLPPLPRREGKIDGFTMIAAVGPFTTSDGLEMEPLHDLLKIVKTERPNILLLLGPFVDSSHQQIKECNLPPETTFDSFFRDCILEPISATCRASAHKTKVILIPSQRDVHHPFCVYPQPPFHLPPKGPHSVVSFSDPATLRMNGLYLGLTSTDILFHLSARTMFKGPCGDRMAKIASHILRQKCYYPLLPAFRRDSHTVASTTPHTSSEPSTSNGVPSTPNGVPSTSNGVPSTSKGNAPSSNQARQPSVAVETEEETTEVNINIIDAFENGHALLPVRPDLLLLPSDLKPFVKVLEGCVCVNPGRLTKKASGGTFLKVRVPDIKITNPDLSSEIGLQIVHI